MTKRLFESEAHYRARTGAAPREPAIAPVLPVPPPPEGGAPVTVPPTGGVDPAPLTQTEQMPEGSNDPATGSEPTPPISLPPDEPPLSRDTVTARYGWVVPPPGGFAAAQGLVAWALGIPETVLAFMLEHQDAPAEDHDALRTPGDPEPPQHKEETQDATQSSN